MKGSGKRKLVKKYVADFIFSERTRFVMDGTNFHISTENPESRFIKFKFEKSNKPRRKLTFRCIYKMMRNFHTSLN